MRAIRSRLVAKNVVIVGGGIAGLAASIYLARGGRTVTLFEKLDLVQALTLESQNQNETKRLGLTNRSCSTFNRTAVISNEE